MEPDAIVQSAFKSMFRGIKAGNYNPSESNSLWHLLTDLDFETGVDTTALQDLKLLLREALDTMRNFNRNVLLSRLQGNPVDEIAVQMNRTSRTNFVVTKRTSMSSQ